MKKKEKSTMMTDAEVRRELKKIGILFAVLIVLGSIFTWQTSVFKMANEAMNPTIAKGDHILVNRFAKEFKSGDIIAYAQYDDENPEAMPIIHVKRLIGLPGDDIGVKDGYLYRNEEKIVQVVSDTEWTNTELTQYPVPDDSYFVTGDNMDYKPEIGESLFIYQDDVIGKVLFQ